MAEKVDHKSAKKFDKKPAAAVPTGNVFAEIAVVLIVLLVVASFIGGILNSLNGATSVTGLIFSKALSFFKTVSALVTMGSFAVATYAFIMIHELVAEENKRLKLTLTWESEKTQKNKRWQRVEEHMASQNPSDWKVAILEADNILDEVTKRMGYSGDTLGERLRVIPKVEFPLLEEAWQAHKFRNALAHKGTDSPLPRSDAERIINIYYRVLSGLGYL